VNGSERSLTVYISVVCTINSHWTLPEQGYICMASQSCVFLAKFAAMITVTGQHSDMTS
jgi:hypothetical protein